MGVCEKDTEGKENNGEQAWGMVRREEALWPGPTLD